MSTLQMRIKNCIETILDLEPSLRACAMGLYLSKELETLKITLERVDHMVLAEEDVQHMEKATDDFLAELKYSLLLPLPKRLLQ